VQAEPDAEGQPNDRQVKLMFQKLLATASNSFSIATKKIFRCMPFSVARGGPKLTTSTGDPSGLPTLGTRAPGKVFTRNASLADSRL